METYGAYFTYMNTARGNRPKSYHVKGKPISLIDFAVGSNNLGPVLISTGTIPNPYSGSHFPQIGSLEINPFPEPKPNVTGSLPLTRPPPRLPYSKMEI
jgi:hypothetical protein